MNNIIIKGRLTREPELKTTSSGVEYAVITVAVDRYVGKDKPKEVDFIPCKVWQQRGVFVCKYFHKGQEILVSGSMRIDNYDKDGEKRSYAYINASDVEFCGSRSSEQCSADSGQQVVNGTFAATESVEEAYNDDDLPF